MADILDFYLNQPEPNKSCLMGLRELIIQFDSEISETVKYGMPCFTFKNKALCYLWTDKKTRDPYILMVDGNLINHPALETGDRARMKILRIDPTKDLPVEDIHEILKAGIQIISEKTSKR